MTAENGLARTMAVGNLSSMPGRRTQLLVAFGPLRLALLLVFMGIAWASPAHAEQAQSRFALVIGNTQYSTAGQLPNATQDAETIGAALAKAGFSVEIRTNLNLDAFDDALDLLEARVADHDVVAFYFAGHGLQHDGVNYLLPVDAEVRTPRALQRETIQLDQVLDILQMARVALVFLDACRNNPLADQLASAQIASERGVRALARGLAVVRPPSEMLISYATLPGEVAYDGGFGNSPYARALARHINTPDVEISVLMKRVTRDVLEETNARQRPQQLSQMQEEFYFLTGGGVETDESGDETLLAVYPGRVGTGDEIALFADVPIGCAPNFFALSPSQSLTPIPEAYFSTHGLASGMLRFEISPGTRFGLVVTEDDPRGTHRIGFYCGRATPTEAEDTLAVVAMLERRFADGTLAGRLDVGEGETVLYHVAEVEIE